MTDQPKWTPGPWRYDRTNGSPTTGEHMIAGAKPGYLAEVRDCGSGDVRANAHLIAAAPDLYAALDDLLASYAEPDQQICCGGHGCGCRGASVRDLAEHHARAAIAKARGQA